MSRWHRFRSAFLPNERNRRFLPFMICFFCAGIGGVVNVLGFHLGIRMLQFVGFFISAASIISSFFAKGWLAWRLFGRDEWRKEMEPQVRVKQPWE